MNKIIHSGLRKLASLLHYPEIPGHWERTQNMLKDTKFRAGKRAKTTSRLNLYKRERETTLLNLKEKTKAKSSRSIKKQLKFWVNRTHKIQKGVERK